MDLEASTAEEGKISESANSVEVSSVSFPKSSVGPRLQALPPDLKKVSAGSISLNASEASSVNPTSAPPVLASPANGSEDIILESRRILASLATLSEPERNEATAKIEALEPVEAKTIVVEKEFFAKRGTGNLGLARRALVRWLGESAESDIPLVDLPKFLLKSPEIQGAAVIDQEGLILALETKLKLNYKVLANLTLRLFSQNRFAAEELETSFQDQVVIGFKKVVLQISYHRGFYLIALFEQLPTSKLLQRLRKVVKALARVEAGG